VTIPRQFMDELRTRVSMSSLVQRTHKIKQSGREWKGCCPFHDEKTPSFYVNDGKQFYHCFGCGAHGDVISWMVDHENMSFMDAIKALAEIAGLEVPAQDPQDIKRAQFRDRLAGVNEAVAEHFYENLMGNDEAKNYLASRGMTADTVTKFRIGWAPPVAKGQGSVLERKWSAETKLLSTLGLVKEGDDGNYDFFRRRVMIPIHDARGHVIGFGGRVLGKGEPKYLNSADSPAFDKGRTLFNHHRAAPEARKAGRLIVVEGYMDVIGLDMVGIHEVVAPNGTAVTEYQLRGMWQIADKPIFMLDGDNAGKKAAVRAAERALPLLQPGKSLSFVFPANGADPDDIARESGADGINAAIDGAVSLLKVLWDDLVEKNDPRNPDSRAKLRSEARELVKSIKNGDVKAAYGQEIATLLGRTDDFRGNYNSQPSAPRQSPADAMRVAFLVAMIDRPAVLFRHFDSVVRLFPQGGQFGTELFEGVIDIVCDGAEEPSGLVPALERQGFEGQLMALRQSVTLKLNINSDQQLEDMLRAFLMEKPRK